MKKKEKIFQWFCWQNFFTFFWLPTLTIFVNLAQHLWLDHEFSHNFFFFFFLLQKFLFFFFFCNEKKKQLLPFVVDCNLLNVLCVTDCCVVYSHYHHHPSQSSFKLRSNCKQTAEKISWHHQLLLIITSNPSDYNPYKYSKTHTNVWSFSF